MTRKLHNHYYVNCSHCFFVTLSFSKFLSGTEFFFLLVFVVLFFEHAINSLLLFCCFVKIVEKFELWFLLSFYNRKTHFGTFSQNLATFWVDDLVTWWWNVLFFVVYFLFLVMRRDLFWCQHNFIDGMRVREKMESKCKFGCKNTDKNRFTLFRASYFCFHDDFWKMVCFWTSF